MKFGNLPYLYLVFLLPVLVGLLLWLRLWRTRAWSKLADLGFKERLMPTVSAGRRRFKNILKVAVFVLLILTLMEPQWGMREEEVKMRGINLMVLADVSSSMMAQDINPDRLQREKREIRDLLGMLKGDRVGLIAFAGRSFLLSPLTNDYGTLVRYVDDLGPETIPVNGTDLAGALQLAIKSFPKEDETKAILIFTDGEDHSEKLPKILKELKKRDIKVFILGVGTPEGAPIPEPGGGFKSTLEGEMVVSKLNETSLKKLALGSGGAYARTVTSDDDLKELYLKGVRGVLTPDDLRVTRKKVWESRFYWPLGIAIFLLLLERLIPEARRQKEWVPMIES